MRREPYTVGSFVHVVKRGARGLVFLKDNTDRDRLLLQLRHFNSESVSPTWIRDLIHESKLKTWERPESWGIPKPLVKIHAFCIHDNHFHLLLEEIREDGISHFMQKIGTGISKYLNERYQENGSPFQGAYKAITVDSDAYLRYVITYIQIKNSFEQFPGGYNNAVNTFDQAYEWAQQFPYSSLHDFLWKSDFHKGRQIVAHDLVPHLWTPAEFKNYSRDMLLGRIHLAAGTKSLL